ncbi:MAG: hypothetical protein Q9192_003590 [Flavoplaca navasiana]
MKCGPISPLPPLDQAFKDKVHRALHALPTAEKVITFNQTRLPGPAGTKEVMYLLPRREPAGGNNDSGQLDMLPTLFLSCACISVCVAAKLHGRQTSVSNSSTTIRPNAYGQPNTNATFDYVIVGGGTAGLAIAARLTQNTSLSVAVVEAGGYYEETVGNISTIPAYAAFNVGTDPNDTNPIDWSFVTEPQPVSKSSYLNA